MQNSLSFSEGFKYPFNRPKGLLNVLWLFVPIAGWFAVGGYSFRINQEFINGKFKELPTFSFASDMKLGWTVFVRSLPFLLAYMLIGGIFGVISAFGSSADFITSVAQTVIDLFVVPMLTMNFIHKFTVGAFFEFDVLVHVREHAREYVEMVLKSIGLFILYGLLAIVLVGIPAGLFVGYIFAADFYRRYVLNTQVA